MSFEPVALAEFVVIVVGSAVLPALVEMLACDAAVTKLLAGDCTVIDCAALRDVMPVGNWPRERVTCSAPPAAPIVAPLMPLPAEVSLVADASFIAETRPVLSGRLKVV